MLGGCVEQNDRNPRKQRAGQKESTPLPGRNRLGATDQHGGQPVEPTTRADSPQRVDRLVVGAIPAGDEQVVPTVVANR